ncbi:MAG TPA: FAD-binding oxidoreductase, partial [Anaerolineae bacterium]|nr:FAD-binding oxidoreductase [Anaerolineae bacterium]
MTKKSPSASNPKKLDNTLYDHRWGFTDSHFAMLPNGNVTFSGSRYEISGTEMPGFLPFAEEILGVKVDTSSKKPEPTTKPIPEPVVNSAFIEAVEATFPASQYSADPRQRLIHSHGQTTADEVYKVIYGKLDRVADLVFYVESNEDAAEIIRLADQHNVCLVPYGGGTSVSNALQLPSAEKRMIVIVNMRRMNKILWIDRDNFRASVQAGISGLELEELLTAEGFTSGHEPDSLELSTLGGWIATNASGMKKNKYGNIEQIVETITLITPRGRIEQLQSQARMSIGMQLQSLLFGSEGNLGLITEAVIRIHALPEVQKFGSIVFPDFKTGTDYLYALMQKDALPASIRLLDNVQFRFGSALKPKPSLKQKWMSKIEKKVVVDFKGFDPHELCAATVLMEGTKEEVAYQSKVIFSLAKKFGGMAGGEGNGKRGYK